MLVVCIFHFLPFCEAHIVSCFSRWFRCFVAPPDYASRTVFTCQNSIHLLCTRVRRPSNSIYLLSTRFRPLVVCVLFSSSCLQRDLVLVYKVSSTGCGCSVLVVLPSKRMAGPNTRLRAQQQEEGSPSHHILALLLWMSSTQRERVVSLPIIKISKAVRRKKCFHRHPQWQRS